MLPMVIFSAVSLFVPHDGVVIFAMVAVFVLWSTRICARPFVELASCGEEHRRLTVYYFSLRSLSLKLRTASRSNSILFLSFGALIPSKSLLFLL
ncbi:hypothetical protein DsansV1_C26g0196171 [Dioscorea sansibarensis]